MVAVTSPRNACDSLRKLKIKGVSGAFHYAINWQITKF